MSGVVPHDAGGKVKTKLPDGMQGGASFDGPNNCYRTTLWRAWGVPNSSFALFIGMNPSTAEADFNDPTITREVGFTRRMGLTTYWKVNVSPYRLTDPKQLGAVTLPLTFREHAPIVVELAKQARRVVMACGLLPQRLRFLGPQLVNDLRAADIPLWCLGTTVDGSPRHPLYLRNDAELVEWKGWT